MPLNPGTKLGPYEILAAIGAGGMGEVYRARDTRLGREVAIKLLAAHLGSEHDKERFQREARVISSLSHSHICALYDIGKYQEQDFLVMELLEGESLADRLQKGALSLRQTLEYGAQIAEALECAHRAGVVHRDLKPGNVMLTAAGVKLLDFGLAKPTATSAAMAAGTPTVSKPLTAEGVIVGTYQYMSPEQVEGKEADARADVFAFGTVLYEMATGKRAFTGKTHVSIMSAIMEKDPEPMSAAQPLTPPAFEHAVQTAMAKDANERWQSAADLGRELRWIAQSGSSSGTMALAPRRSKRYTRWAALGLTVAAAVIAGFFMRPAPTPAPVAASLNLSGQMSEEGSFVLSPDGSKLAYFATDPQGRFLLWVRPLDSPKAQALDGTESGEYPFWSADGKSIGFFADNKLKRIDAAGQNLQVICDAVNGRGGTWSRDGVILFAPNAQGGVFRVAASGGTPVQVTKATELISHRFPQFLPDGKHFVFTLENGKKGEDGTYAGSLDSPEIKLVGAGASSSTAYADGFLFTVRDGNLTAQPFDVRGLRMTGEPVRVGEGVRWAPDRRAADFSAANGTIVFSHATEAGERLVWFDREGKQLGTAVPDIGIPTSGLLAGSLSPDGNRAAIVRRRGTGSDIWIYKLATGLGTRVTFTDDLNESPLWSADGSKIVFTRNLIDHYELKLKSVSGASDEQVLVSTPDNLLATSWSRDGRYIFYSGNVFASDTKVQGMALPLEGDRKPFATVKSAGNVLSGSFSPDGRWLAYTSDETGRTELYATTFPGQTGKWQISTEGVDPLVGGIWVGAGKDLELIFVDLQFRMFAVPVQLEGSSLSMGAPKMLLGGRSLASSQFIDVTRDGKRILAGMPQENANTPLTLLLNWSQELKK